MTINITFWPSTNHTCSKYKSLMVHRLERAFDIVSAWPLVRSGNSLYSVFPSEMSFLLKIASSFGTWCFCWLLPICALCFCTTFLFDYSINKSDLDIWRSSEMKVWKSWSVLCKHVMHRVELHRASGGLRTLILTFIDFLEWSICCIAFLRVSHFSHSCLSFFEAVLWICSDSESGIKHLFSGNYTGYIWTALPETSLSLTRFFFVLDQVLSNRRTDL